MLSANGRTARILLWTALASIPGSIVLTWILIEVVWRIGEWVGAGHEPIPPVVNIAFVPGVACALAGVAVTILAAVRRALVAAVCGFLAAVAGAAQVLFVGIVIALGHIS